MNLPKLSNACFGFVIMAVTVMTVRTLPTAVTAEMGRNPPATVSTTKQISSRNGLWSHDYSSNARVKNEHHHVPEVPTVKVPFGKNTRTRHRDVPAALTLHLGGAGTNLGGKDRMRLMKRLRQKRGVKSIPKNTVMGATEVNSSLFKLTTSFKSVIPTSPSEAATGSENSIPPNFQHLTNPDFRTLTTVTQLPVVQTAEPEQGSNSVQIESSTLISNSGPPVSSPASQTEGTYRDMTSVPNEQPQLTTASSSTLPKLPGSSPEIIAKTKILVSPRPDVIKELGTLPLSSTPLPDTQLPTVSSNASLWSAKQDIEERTSERDCIGRNCRTVFLPANRWTNDAYWAFGSLVTVLLLLTVAVLYTGLWKKRNHMSNPISDVNCHAKASPSHQGNTDIKDLLKTKVYHLKNLNNSPLSSSRKQNGNGQIGRRYPKHSDYLPLSVKDDDEEEEFCWQWGPRMMEHSM